MTKYLCQFLPLSAAENIPSCNITTKKGVNASLTIVSVAIGAASLAMSMANSVQIGNLQHQVAVVESALSRFSRNVEIHGAQLSKLTLKHIQLTEELEITQQALDDIIPVLDKHSEAITILKTGFERLQFELRHSFLYLAITQICNNELTLDFLSPEDIHNVVYNVIKFFFAVPRQEQRPYYTYKLLTIPFFHENETIELTRIPRYWAINQVDNTTIEWHHPEESGCDLRLMTSCRDTPPIRTISKDTCLDEIIAKLPLSRCQTTSIPAAKYFLRQLRDNFWITLSPKSLHCVKTPRSDYLSGMQQTWNMNEEIIHPSVSLVNVTQITQLRVLASL
ncbi:unnamed protein product, partial [Rotaria magnacalcarata]